MKRQATKTLPKGLQRRQRREIDTTSEALVTSTPMFEDGPIPLLVEPAIAGVDLGGWAESNADDLETWLETYGAILFRGFGIDTVEAFERVVGAASNGPALDYKDRSTPRETRGSKVYTSTVYPADQTIKLHNEGTYWLTWAMKLFFCCRVAASRGGETPIADVRRVYDRLPSTLLEPFEKKGMALVRNYNDGFGLPWQEVFQTEDRQEVEQYCRDNDIEFEWKDGDRLRTRQVRPAVRRHPKSGKPVWFNHAAFFHNSSLDPDLRRALLDDFGEEGLPYNTTYGDGTPIPDDVVAAIQGAYAAETVMFPWQVGDVMLLDNMAVAHARQPYEGEREVVVMMTEPHTGAETLRFDSSA